MERIPEQELMSYDQAQAYARVDLSDAHDRFIELFKAMTGASPLGKYVLELGCGTADITYRFARAFRQCLIHAIDGSREMLHFGKLTIRQDETIVNRVIFLEGDIAQLDIPNNRYDCVIANSLLHHLRDPKFLWRAVKKACAPNAPVFIMDLRRPREESQARQLVEKYAAGLPGIFQKDFYNSLNAAFEVDEIKEQLKEEGLDYFSVRPVGDRHVVISGFYQAVSS